MDYCCDVCDRTIKFKSESKHLHSLRHHEFEKCIQRKNSIENAAFFNMNAMFNEYISNHKKKDFIYILSERISKYFLTMRFIHTINLNFNKIRQFFI